MANNINVGEWVAKKRVDQEKAWHEGRCEMRAMRKKDWARGEWREWGKEDWEEQRKRGWDERARGQEKYGARGTGRAGVTVSGSDSHGFLQPAGVGCKGHSGLGTHPGFSTQAST
ncbi:hypothetical protein EI94DRAFT_1703483 [Lactarius quietus]|nr:hypothetical protein EI94DRAFT_1703483 [Lactarius quietus]